MRLHRRELLATASAPGREVARAHAPDVWDDTVAFLAEHLGTPRT